MAQTPDQFTQGWGGFNAGIGQKNPQWGYPGAERGSYGGIDYQNVNFSHSQVPLGLRQEGGIGSAADTVLQASSGAEAALRRGYEAMLREQAGNVAGAQEENDQRTRATLTAGGVSPMLANLIGGGRNLRSQADYGGAVAGATAGFETDRANLIKSTGTELAGIKEYDIGLLMGSHNAYQAAQAAQPSGIDYALQVAGLAIGAGGLGQKKS